jgi:hypothetical protein
MLGDDADVLEDDTDVLDGDTDVLMLLVAECVVEEMAELVKLGLANVCCLPMMVMIYGSPTKLMTSFPDAQLQSLLQQYESLDEVELQLNTGFPSPSAIDRKDDAVSQVRLLGPMVGTRGGIHTILTKSRAGRRLPGLVRASPPSESFRGRVIAELVGETGLVAEAAEAVGGRGVAGGI